MFPLYLRKICLIFSSIFLFTACVAPTVKLRFSEPAKIDTSGIKRVAVANFKIMEIRRASTLERNGQWKTHATIFSQKLKNEIAKQIRGKVINLLSTSPSFELVYADEFSQLEDDAAISKMVAAGGFKVKKVDGVISGKVWIDVENYDGVDLDKLALKYVQQANQASPAYTVDALLFWPYKSISGALALEIKLTRTDPTEVVAVAFEKRSFSNKIGGQPPDFLEKIKNAADTVSKLATKKDSKDIPEDEKELVESDMVLPNFTQLVSDLAESIAADFSKKISINEKDVEVSIATGGDSIATQLIKANAFDMAIERLNKVAATKNSANTYNLGVCYEAIGEYGLASVAYEEALKSDNSNLTFAEGVGRIERLKKEYRQIKAQLRRK